MGKHLTIAATLLASALFVSSCDEDTASLGIYDDMDGITNSTEVAQVITRSVKMDSVVANSTVCYLGSITDPETNSDITASFAAQFYSFEDYSFPERQLMVGDKDNVETRGIVQCDSCEVRLYFNSYYGDYNNPMKLEVYELSHTNILSEDSVYYTDVNLAQYLPDDASPLATRMFTPRDMNVDNSTLASSSYNPNVRVVLPRSLGQRMMEKYFENPSYYKNSYSFVRNVFPGLYFKTSGGKGTMLSVYVGTINVYYRYADEEQGTIYSGLTRFAATPEVIQSTRFENEDVDELLRIDSCTYLKTPTGICTEMTLPVDELFAGSHATDSISMASVTLTRYNKPQTAYQLATPSELLMVRKGESHAFFREHRVADGRTSYTTTFSNSYNTYTFSNIGRLISYMKHEKVNLARQQGISEEEWAARNPDWNKVLLVPVVTTTNASGVLVSVTHDLNLGSIRLVGGTTPLTMQVVYSKYNQK